MKTVGEGKGGYSYSGNQIPIQTRVMSKSSAKAGTKNAYGDYAHYMQNYGQPAYGNMSAMANPMMGAASMSYQSMPMGRMSMPATIDVQQPQSQQYSMQSLQSMQPTQMQMQSIPNLQMYQPTLTRLSEGSPPPQQYSSFPNGPRSAGQQMPWLQYRSMPAMSTYHVQGRMQGVMPTYSTNPGQDSFIVDYSDGLKILDEPTGGTNYMTKNAL